MNHQTYPSISKLVDAAQDLLADVDVVSFDMFDTLLVRRVHDPDLVKEPVARFISSLAAQRDIPISWQQVQAKRDEIEQAERDETGLTFDDHEALYPSFMTKTLGNIFNTDSVSDLLRQVTEYEMKIENAMLVPRVELIQWMDRLIEQGKRLIVISDIYLPASNLETLLEHADILQKVETVVSSADSFLAKASGKGFDFVKEKLGLDNARWLHIGDNPISDGVCPADKGIRALVLQDPNETRRKALAARYFFYSRSRIFWMGRALQQLMAPLEAENQERSKMYIEGYNFLGPLLGVFVQRVAEHCRQEGITKIFFLSREGWMFKRIWEKITPFLYPQGGLPEIEYLYVSRLSLAGATCAQQGLTRENTSIVFLPPGNKDFSDICRVFSLDGEKLKPHLARFELALQTTLSPAHSGFDPVYSGHLEDLLNDEEFQNEVKRQSKESNQLLTEYLKSVGFFDHKDVALVDIGWLGTIQRFFHDAIKHIDERPNCHGLLFGASRGIAFDSSSKSHIKGMVYDRQDFSLAASSIMYARDIFEEACRAPHPTTTGYARDADGVAKPILREMDDALGQSELQQDSHYFDFQQGILDSADRYGAAAAIISVDSNGFRPWINYLMVSKLAFASQREIKTLHYKYHLDDFHGKNKPKARRRPRFFNNPWESKGWKSVIGCLFPRKIFKNHMRNILNQ